MNKDLIAKLKETAWLDAITMSYTDEHKCRISSDYFRMLEQNRFAELIVKECAIIANKAENSDSELRSMYDVITEHFGINK